MIGTHDLEGRILSANRAVARLSGFQQAEELVGVNIKDLLAPEVRHRFSSYIETIVKEGRAEGLMKIRTRNGEERILHYHNFLHTRDQDQRIVRCYGNNVTEQKRLEAHLRHSQKMGSWSI
ncbi:MAG: PAS domain S-box protein [Acidobacteria bacterium]|nr:PAS domain S-box protein [Acidobacteriota bacterium]